MWKGVIFLKGKRMLGVLLAATVALGVAGSAGAKDFAALCRETADRLGLAGPAAAGRTGA